MTAKRFIQNKSLEEDSIVISDGVIDRTTGRILRYDKEYCAFLNYLHEENKQLKQELDSFRKWETYVGKAKREELDRLFKMSVYEIAEAFQYYKKRIKEVEDLE